jgi:hypothetical protein
MIERQAIALREKLRAHRSRLLDHAAQQVEANPPSWDWLRMLGDVQVALTALEEEAGKPAP